MLNRCRFTCQTGAGVIWTHRACEDDFPVSQDAYSAVPEVGDVHLPVGLHHGNADLMDEDGGCVRMLGGSKGPIRNA